MAVIAIPYDEFMNPLKSLRRDTIIMLAIAIVLVSLVINVLINKTVIKPIRMFTDKMQKAKTGDLTSSVEVKSRDEFRYLADSYNGMLDNIRKLVMNAAHISDKSEETVESITSSVEEVSVSSQEISNSVQEIAIGANNQAEES
ncbi:HAMP domain-containing protein, partial [Methanosarcina mazei]|uniref:HAMP domain-containing protein n=1 Tax=Methanosarcina mazei TaxID=2209 RepID=UPI00064F9113